MRGEKLSRLMGRTERVSLGDGTEVLVKPFTIEEWEETERLEPGALGGLAFARLKLYLVMRHVPGFETTGDTEEERYSAWKLDCNGEVLEALGEVSAAIERVNATFRPRDAVRTA